MMRKHLPVWPDGKEHGKLDEQGMFLAGQIASELDHPSADWLVFDREYTQSVDTSALEPDNANCWYDTATQSLHLVVPTQSPLEVAENAAAMVAKCRFPVKKLFVHPCYTVGYGSKDHFNVPFYGLVCALYADGRPVRFANDRYEQFQTSLKRHAFKMHYRIAVDRNTGLLQSFKGDFEANGGGRSNFAVGGDGGGDGRAIDLLLPEERPGAVAIASRAIDAGSARGYGTLQSMAATEMAVDEIAAQLNIDPIDFRLRNALRSGMKNTQGRFPPARCASTRCSSARSSIRCGRAAPRARPNTRPRIRATLRRRLRVRAEGFRHGRGSVVREGRIRRERQGVAAAHGGRDRHRMSTSQAVAVAKWLGRPATDVRVAVTEWPDLPVETSGDPYLMSQAEGSSERESALVAELCVAVERDELRVLLHAQHARSRARGVPLRPVAGGDVDLDARPRRRRRAVHDPHRGRALGRRQADRRRPRAAVVRATREAGPCARPADRRRRARVQPLAVDRRRVRSGRHGRAPADRRAVAACRRTEDGRQRPGAGTAAPAGATTMRGTLAPTANGYRVLDRKRVFIPPTSRNNAAVTYHTAVGTLVELAVHEATGRSSCSRTTRSWNAATRFRRSSCRASCRVVSRWGSAMRCTNTCRSMKTAPATARGTSTVTSCRASDVAVWTQTGDVLPPLSETDPPKGVAEVVMIPVVGAIVNGIAHAIGHRFTDLPVTPQKIQEVLA